MTKQELDQIIKRIAREQNTTPEKVRREMELAIEEAMSSRNPFVRARWKKMPYQGEKPTLEEVMEYLVKRVEKRRSFLRFWWLG